MRNFRNLVVVATLSVMGLVFCQHASAGLVLGTNSELVEFGDNSAAGRLDDTPDDTPDNTPALRNGIGDQICGCPVSFESGSSFAILATAVLGLVRTTELTGVSNRRHFRLYARPPTPIG